jgi:hypothetical protein
MRILLLKLQVLCSVVQQVVPDISKDHTAFIFRVKQFFLDYLTLKMKALHTCKMTGTTCPMIKHNIPRKLESFFLNY